MSWNKLLLALALLFSTAAYAQEAKCPSYHEKRPLVSVDVFSGPPEQLADLVPDVGHGTGDHAYALWKVGYLFDNRETLYLVCKFGDWGTKDTVTVKVEKKVQRCIYRAHPGGKPAEMACR